MKGKTPQPDRARRQWRERRLVAIAHEQCLETHYLFVGRASAVPQVIGSRDLGILRPIVSRVVVHRSSFSRSSFMPRCRFTRTDAGVSPVRSAISGPVIPST